MALDDSLCATPKSQTVVVGCGNLLRGDDAVGPILIRHLWDRGVGDLDGVTLVDGGTAGMDVAFKMRGADHVVLIDAALSGGEPGALYRVPGEELEDLPPLEGLHSHQFRWDHALAFARWLLAEDYPERITVFLIEAAEVEHGAPLSDPVAAAMSQLIETIVDLVSERSTESETGPAMVEAELSEQGDLRLTAEMANRWFPNDSLVALRQDDELLLFPLTGPERGGLFLKQRTQAGDRSTLLSEILGLDHPTGPISGRWDAEAAAMRFDLSKPTTSHGDAR